MVKWGFLDEDFSEKIALTYDEAKDFSEGYAPVRVGEKWGLIDAQGNLVLDPVFDEINTFRNGCALVEFDGKYGYIKIK